MWIEPLKNGKFRAVERYEDPLTGKEKKISVTIDRNTAPARKAAQKTLEEKIQGKQHITTKDNITLGELADRYLANQKQELKPSSYIQTDHHIRQLMKIIGPDCIVSRLTAGIVSDKLRSAGKTPYTTNRDMKYFKAMIRWGYVNDLVEDKEWLDKIQKVTDRQNGIEKTEEKYLESEELKTLINGMEGQDRLITEFLALSGLRIGELLALEDSDIDGEGIHVTKDMYNGVINETPKTDSSNRVVYVQPELVSVVAKIRRLTRAVKFALGDRSARFMVFSYPAYRRTLQKAGNELLGRNVTPHMLRHTHTSLLAEQGIPLEAISRRLGHHDSKITREIYLHVTEKRKKMENAMIAAVKIL